MKKIFWLLCGLLVIFAFVLPGFGSGYIANEIAIYRAQLEIGQYLEKNLQVEIEDQETKFGVLGGSSNYCGLDIWTIVSAENKIDFESNPNYPGYGPLMVDQNILIAEIGSDPVQVGFDIYEIFEPNLTEFVKRPYEPNKYYYLVQYANTWRSGIGFKDLRCH